MPASQSSSRRASGKPPDLLGRPEYAAAFLQRNPAYRAEHAQMQKRIARGVVAKNAAEAAFARRWGLSFRRITG